MYHVPLWVSMETEVVEVVTSDKNLNVSEVEEDCYIPSQKNIQKLFKIFRGKTGQCILEKTIYRRNNLKVQKSRCGRCTHKNIGFKKCKVKVK